MRATRLLEVRIISGQMMAREVKLAQNIEIEEMRRDSRPKRELVQQWAGPKQRSREALVTWDVRDAWPRGPRREQIWMRRRSASGGDVESVRVCWVMSWMMSWVACLEERERVRER